MAAEPRCTRRTAEKIVPATTMWPGRRLRPGCGTREWPCAIGQASQTPTQAIWVVVGRSPVILATIGSRISPQKALFRRTRQNDNACETGPEIVGFLYKQYANITINKTTNHIYKHRMGFWGFGVMSEKFQLLAGW